MDHPDYLDTLYDIVDALNAKYPDGVSPYQLVTRLTEEVGELAQAVNHMERSGIKVEKYGPPDKAHLAQEVHHVLRAALGIARYYGVEDALKESIDASHDWHRAHGYLTQRQTGVIRSSSKRA